MDDAELLRAYLHQRSEEAFRELVRRHIAVVHAVARRQPGVDEHLAADVAQRVFVALAAKARALVNQASLVGWLYVAARIEAARAVRTEVRRRERETKASIMNSDESTEHVDAAWEQLRPVLDAGMAQLGGTEREAILLRYFSGRSLAEVGRALGVSEEAARKRVDRAVDKLRDVLRRRGIVSTSTALCAALGAHAAPRVPEAIVTAVANGTLAQAVLSSGAPVFLFMSSTKLTFVAAAVVLVLATTSAVRDRTQLAAAEQSVTAARAELTALHQQQDARRREQAAAERARAEADARERSLIATTPNPARPYLQDPVYRELARAASHARRRLEFQRLYRQLQLSPEQQERFEAIMVRQDEANLDGQIARDLGRDEQAVYRRSGPEWNQAMRELLGPDGMRQLEDYLRAMPVRNFVDEIAARSYEGADPITPAQADRLIAVALAHDPFYSNGKGTDPGKVNWNDVWEPAATFLSPEQVATFETAVEVWSLQKRLSLARQKANGGR